MSYLCAGLACTLSALCYAEYACDYPMVRRRRRGL